MNIHLPRRICAMLPRVLEREWLVTNGLGGFAAGTVAGALTRRYHGLLFAATEPPVGRRLLVAKLHETALRGGCDYRLDTNLWRDGPEHPNACAHLARFDFLLGVPTWTFNIGAAQLVRRVWMEPGRNITYVQFEHFGVAGGEALDLQLRLLVNDRYYHHLALVGAQRFQVAAVPAGLRVVLPYTRQPLDIHAYSTSEATARWELDGTWWHGFELPVEAARGFDHCEDHFSAGALTATLAPGELLLLALSAEGACGDEAWQALERRQVLSRQRLAGWLRQAGQSGARVPLMQLALAADQFVVARTLRDEPQGQSLIAGYPWFTDWGRDTMIALPGLTLVTGRFDLARRILRTWARYVDRGMIPNRFPDEGGAPEYHTADATLWYLWAVDQYARFTGDLGTLAELFPVLREIIAWHRRGTRHNIHIGEDGLVYAGERGLNLTWMDAKIGDRVITPRIGKPIELSALWYDGLRNLARLAPLVGVDGDEYTALADATQASFARFWNPKRSACFDVLDGLDGADDRLRANQIIAVALEHSALTANQQRAVVDACERELLAWYAVRTLAPGEPGYRGQYAGGPVQRDEAYHEGTAWGWLLGALAIAHFRVHGDAAAARGLLEPALGQLWRNGIGTLSEVYSADEPHSAGGCPAQAWSVAEVLRAWHYLRA